MRYGLGAPNPNPSSFGTVFERLETLKELEIQYSQPERATTSHNRLLEALTFLSSLRVIESPIGRVPIITQTFDRIRLFQNESKIF